MTTFVKGLWLVGWLWHLERRRGHSWPTALLFVALLALVIGLLQIKGRLPQAALPAIFWIAYLFTLFQALPRSFLEIRSESWLWLGGLVTAQAAGWGLLGYILSWGFALYGVLGLISWGFWGYTPPPQTLLNALTLSIPVGLAGFMAARAQASYALGIVLALPLTVLPLLLLFLKPSVPFLPTLLLLFAQAFLIATLIPYLWNLPVHQS